MPADRPCDDLDVVVIGAGFAGLYALHRLRQAGLSVQVVEAAEDVGGTWLWNGYPGARCDVESLQYSYLFSPELDQEWTWSERYAGQPEILAYLRYVADRFDLRRDIRFGTCVTSMHWEDERWTVQIEDGQPLRSRFLILATGSLSAPLTPGFPGADEFRGESYMTQSWPREPVNFTGKRVAVIGTGSSGIQVVPVVAEQAAHLTVFQRTANFSVPGRNRKLGASEIATYKASYPQHRAAQRQSRNGVLDEINPRRAAELTPDQQRAELEKRWSTGGGTLISLAFRDVMLDPDANLLVQDFIREKIRAKVHDPAVAELLCPDDHPFGAKRPCVDHGYYEAFNRGNVELVGIRHNPIERITADGIVLRDGTEFTVDTIIYALGYDAVSGAIDRLDIRGRDGIRLRDLWRDGPQTYLGLSFAGFPNLFSLCGPGSPSVLALPIATAEMQVDWIADAIAELDQRRTATIEATVDAQSAWTEEVSRFADRTLYTCASNSYYLGANVPGKARTFSIYLGGLAEFRRRFAEVAADGYRGFELSKPASEEG